MQFIAHLLDLESRDVSIALSKNGKLSRTGLLKNVDFGHASLSFEYVNNDFIQLMLEAHLNPIELFCNYFKRAEAGHRENRVNMTNSPAVSL